MSSTTTEWLDEVVVRAGAHPGRTGVDARAQFVLTGAPDGANECYLVLGNGTTTEHGLGALDDPDVTMTLTWDDAVAVAAGDLDADVAFMQGRMKASGDTGKLFDVLFSMRS